MKKLVSVALSLMLCIVMLSAACAGSVVETIAAVGTTQSFSQEEVPEEDILTILQAGLSAASAINQQPWFFVAITDKALMAEISGSGFRGAPGGAPGDGTGFTPPEGFSGQRRGLYPS